MLINLKTNKYMIMKEWKKKKKKKKEKKNTSVLRKVGMLEYASQSKGLHGYSKHNCFCRKNFKRTHAWLSLVCCNIYSLFTQNKSLVTLNIVNDET